MSCGEVGGGTGTVPDTSGNEMKIEVKRKHTFECANYQYKYPGEEKKTVNFVSTPWVQTNINGAWSEVYVNGKKICDGVECCLIHEGTYTVACSQSSNAHWSSMAKGGKTCTYTFTAGKNKGKTITLTSDDFQFWNVCGGKVPGVNYSKDGRAGIRIHQGSGPIRTVGCLVVGTHSGSWDMYGEMKNSLNAFKTLYNAIKQAKSVKITYS